MKTLLPLIFLSFFSALCGFPEEEPLAININIKSEQSSSLEHIHHRFVARNVVALVLGKEDASLEKTLERALNNKKEPKSYPELKRMRNTVLIMIGLNEN